MGGVWVGGWGGMRQLADKICLNPLCVIVSLELVGYRGATLGCNVSSSMCCGAPSASGWQPSWPRACWRERRSASRATCTYAPSVSSCLVKHIPQSHAHAFLLPTALGPYPCRPSLPLPSPLSVAAGGTQIPGRATSGAQGLGSVRSPGSCHTGNVGGGHGLAHAWRAVLCQDW